MMLYDSNVNLPRNVRSHLPKPAQDIYRETFNHVWEFYKEPRKKTNKKKQARASSLAWYAVAYRFKKNGDGEWVES